MFDEQNVIDAATQFIANTERTWARLGITPINLAVGTRIDGWAFTLQFEVRRPQPDTSVVWMCTATGAPVGPSETPVKKRALTFALTVVVPELATAA